MPATDRHAAQRAFWDAQADRFDEAPDHGLHDPAARAAWRSLLQAHLPPAPVDVLDLGCGTGTLTVLLARDGHRVRGIDLSPAMVERARAKVAAAGVHARVEEGDAADPVSPPAAYDVVLTRHLLWALPDPRAAVTRWVELLRPAGRLLLVEGRWWTGGGLTAAECGDLLDGLVSPVAVVPLDDPALWGGPVTDERYLVVAGPR